MLGPSRSLALRWRIMTKLLPVRHRPEFAPALNVREGQWLPPAVHPHRPLWPAQVKPRPARRTNRTADAPTSARVAKTG